MNWGVLGGKVYLVGWLGILAVALLGCVGGGSPGIELVRAVEREGVEAQPTTEWRYVRDGERLAFQTPEPTPTPTPWPTRPAVESFRGGINPGEGAVRGGAVVPEIQRVERFIWEGVGCVDYYRQLLRSYWGPAEFGPETAFMLSGELVKQRSDCRGGGVGAGIWVGVGVRWGQRRRDGNKQFSDPEGGVDADRNCGVEREGQGWEYLGAV